MAVPAAFEAVEPHDRNLRRQLSSKELHWTTRHNDEIEKRGRQRAEHLGGAVEEPGVGWNLDDGRERAVEVGEQDAALGPCPDPIEERRDVAVGHGAAVVVVRAAFAAAFGASGPRIITTWASPMGDTGTVVGSGMAATRAAGIPMTLATTTASASRPGAKYTTEVVTLEPFVVSVAVAPV